MVPVAYALVFGLFRAVHGRMTPIMIVSGLIGGTGLAGLVLVARTRGQWIGAIWGLSGGVVIAPLCCVPWTSPGPHDVSVIFLPAGIIGLILCEYIRNSIDNPRPPVPDELEGQREHDMDSHGGKND